jgi:hypothetical protein
MDNHWHSTYLPPCLLKLHQGTGSEISATNVFKTIKPHPIVTLDGKNNIEKQDLIRMSSAYLKIPFAKCDFMSVIFKGMERYFN